MSSTGYVILFVILIICFVMIIHLVDTHYKPKHKGEVVKDVQAVTEQPDEVKPAVKPDPPRPKDPEVTEGFFDNLFKAIDSRTLKEYTKLDRVSNGVEGMDMVFDFVRSLKKAGMYKIRDSYRQASICELIGFSWSDLQALKKEKEPLPCVWRGDIKECDKTPLFTVFTDASARLNRKHPEGVPVWQEIYSLNEACCLSRDGFVRLERRHTTERECIIELNLGFDSSKQRNNEIGRLTAYYDVLEVTTDLIHDDNSLKVKIKVTIHTDLEETATLVLPMPNVPEKALQAFEKAMKFKSVAMVFRAYAKGDRNYGRLVVTVEGVDKLKKPFCLILASKDGFFSVMSNFEDVLDNSILDYVPTEMLHEPTHATVTLGQKQVVISTF
jgi:hypothetical protein